VVVEFAPCVSMSKITRMHYLVILLVNKQDESTDTALTCGSNDTGV
jgi:hypothetical protein